MVKKRIYELAKELNIESKDIINKLADIGMRDKKPASALEDEQIEHIMKTYKGAEKPAAKPVKEQQTRVETEQAGQRQPVGATVGEHRQQQKPFAAKQGVSQNSQDRYRQPGGDAKKKSDGRRDTHKFDRGPGLVDRVPSRPPDRRFEDRPNRPPMQQSRPQPPRGGQPAGATPDRNLPSGEQYKTRPPADGQQPQPALSGQRDNAAHQQQPSQMKKRPEDNRTDYRQPGSADNRPAAGNNAPRPGYQTGGQGAPGQNRYPRDSRPRPQGAQGGQQQYGKPRPPGERGPYQGPRSGQADGRPPYSGGGGQPNRPFTGGNQGNRPPGNRPPGPRPAGGPVGGRPKPDQLKVPKVPEQAKDLDKVKASEKSRTRLQQNQAKGQAKGREKARPTSDYLAERKLRPSSGKKKSSRHMAQETQPAPVLEKKPVIIGETATVQELAEKMKKSPAELIKRLMHMGVLATINQEIDSDTATIIAGEFGFELEVKIELDAEQLLEQEQEESPDNLADRPCVVTIMGHVDHGKTSLLDAIRETNVIATEAGGITQHIGAYQVEHNNKRITFVDTPGHEAFTAMRARGAQVTDIAILVVAADDGVMPQTIEAINHAKAAEVPIIVAVNKIDKPGADAERVKQQLTEHALIPEEWGGETIFAPVSAKTREGLDNLLEMILLVAEVGELKANPGRSARGTVIEAELDKGRGPVATILVQNGTLRVGDNIVAGTAFGRVRAMMDDKGRRIKKAGPSTPIEVLGFHDVPLAGDLFYALEDEKTARQISDKRTTRKRQEEMKHPAVKVTLDDLFKHIQEGQVKELCLIIKADVQGSVEAVKQSLERLTTGEVKVNIIHGGVGAISETDIMLASASNAIIIGFNVRPDVNARKAAEAEKVDIRLYRVIYDAIEDVKAAMSGLLDPEIKEVILGRVEIRKTFKVSKLGVIAGCYVVEGKVTRDAGVRLIRDGVVIFEGKLDSLKRFKDDAKEVLQGFECGLTLDKFNDLREGDIIEAFTTEAVKRELA